MQLPPAMRRNGMSILNPLCGSPKPLTIGSLIAFEAAFLWKALSYTYEITKYIPGQTLMMRTAEGPFPVETTNTWTQLSEGQTRMTLPNRGKPSGFSKLFAPFMGWMMKKENRKDLKRIKKILENG